MVTKAIVQAINAAGTACTIRIPLFESAADPLPAVAKALVSITPGIFNNIEVGDIVFIAFEENAIEKPIIIGKLFRGANIERASRGGSGIVDVLKVGSNATLPAATKFEFPANLKGSYKEFSTYKNAVDYIKWLETFTKLNITQQENNFICFKNWAQWQLKAENVEIDDGDLDDPKYKAAEERQYQNEGDTCKICQNCVKADNKRCYLKLPSDKIYPKT